jgi:hypothetical protein
MGLIGMAKELVAGEPKEDKGSDMITKLSGIASTVIAGLSGGRTATAPVARQVAQPAPVKVQPDLRVLPPADQPKEMTDVQIKIQQRVQVFLDHLLFAEKSKPAENKPG